VKISKRLSWLKPYLMLACHRYHIKMPLSVRAFTPRWDKNQDSLAMVTKVGLKNYRISIHMYYKEDTGDLILLPNIMILDSLAHELAHIKEWSHNKDWKKLYQDIYSEFKKIHIEGNNRSLTNA